MIFKFKQFEVLQEKSAMKIGTDSVLLGCFVTTDNRNHILDIGTGTGILGLMMAQKTEAHIDAIELDEEAFKEAEQNFSESKWSDRLQIIHTSLQDFKTDQQYDLIVSNPPYYKQLDNVTIIDEQRSRARHDKDLPFDILCEKVFDLLTADGLFWVILPIQEALVFKGIAAISGLHLSREIWIKPKPNKSVNRVVMCFSKKETPYKQNELMIYHSNGEHTDAYYELTKDFYLWKERESDK